MYCPLFLPINRGLNEDNRTNNFTEAVHRRLQLGWNIQLTEVAHSSLFSVIIRNLYKRFLDNDNKTDTESVH